MSKTPAEQTIRDLCKLFNSGVDVGYTRERDEWHVSLRGIYSCVETGSTMKYQDGRVEKLLAAGHSLSGRGASLAEAVENLERHSTKNGRGFVVSNQTFGLFSMNDDDGPHIITVYEGTAKVDSFPYDKEKVRAAIHKYRIG
jgi:hypothetical protein